MRLSSLSVVALLLLSSLSFGQHHDSASPSPPPPSPPPSAPVHVSSPAPAPSPAPSFSPTPAPAPSFTPSPAPASTVHSEPSSPPATRAPESHIAPSTIPSNSTSQQTNPGKSVVSHSPETNTERVIPEQRIIGEKPITGVPRIGENPPVRVRPAEPDLRKHICVEGPCTEPAPKPVPPESDLRKHICINGPCTCPAGQTATKNGCVANVVNNIQDTNTCQTGQYWNGAACQYSQQCRPGLIWNGVTCVPSAAECASLETRAAGLITELRALRARLTQSCGANPPASDCDAVKQERAGTRQRYEMLLSEGPAQCASALPPAASFYDEFQ